jgi:hypothetical protein
LTSIACGAWFVVGIDDASKVAGWGYFDVAEPPANSIPFFVPADLGPVRLVRASRHWALAVTLDGEVRVWGSSGVEAVVNVPPGAAEAIDVQVGLEAAVALTSDGSVVVWGLGGIVENFPTDLGPCTSIAASGQVAFAVAESGEVRCWGFGQSVCPVPSSLGSSISVASSLSSHAVALRADGSVVSWGLTNPSLPPPPPESLTNCVAVVADTAGQLSGIGTLVGAIRADGTAAIWGNGGPADAVPASLGGEVRSIAFSGIRTFALVDEFVDCNLNGIDDSAEIEAGSALDCNGDWIPDGCQFAQGSLEDCNSNGIADVCEKTSRFEANSGQLGPIGFGSTQVWSAGTVPAAASHVSVAVTARGDFSSVNEYVVVRLNGDAIGLALIDGADCSEIGPEDLSIPSATFNALLGPSGAATFTFEPTIAVNANACPSGTWIAARMSYNGATELDCNANGLLDACEIAAGYVDDCNGDGIPDPCQDTTADCNANGAWDSCDIASGAADDCNANGIPDSCDVGSRVGQDCNRNGQPDACDIADGTETDCNDNNVPDSCDVASGLVADCNGNGLPDTCDLAGGVEDDCNSNGVPDSCDIAAGSEADINGNGIPDSCEGLLCPGDVNSDGKVDAADLAVVLGFWGPVGAFPAADINGSGVIDAGDLAILLGSWGSCS